MPKVVSKSIVCPDKRTKSRDDNALTVYYCWCGQIGLIIDCKVHKLPLRERDGARVIDPKKHNFKLSCIDMKKPLLDDVAYVKWSDTEIEKQYRLKCKKCNLWAFYKHEPDSLLTSPVFVVNKSMNTHPRKPLPAAKIGGSVKDDQTGQSSTSASIRRSQTNPNRRFGSVTVSTMEEEEAESEANEIANSYELNATIVKRELERQEELRKRRRIDDP